MKEPVRRDRTAKKRRARLGAKPDDAPQQNVSDGQAVPDQPASDPEGSDQGAVDFEFGGLDQGLEDAISKALEEAMPPATDDVWPEGLDEGDLQAALENSLETGGLGSGGPVYGGSGAGKRRDHAPAPTLRQERDSGFFNRRKSAAQKLTADRDIASGDADKHKAWFQAAYQNAGSDEAAVPWADLKPKPELIGWLENNPGQGRMALDVGCGLGDNAEALSEAGWKVTGFDISEEAISWAKKRFPDTHVHYEVADLLSPPPLWGGAFDLVFECYNLQAFAPGDLRNMAIEAVSRLVRPGGMLFLYSLLGKGSPEGEAAKSGPPWPMTLEDLDRFKTHGLDIDIQRPGVHVDGSGMAPYVTALFRKPSSR